MTAEKILDQLGKLEENATCSIMLQMAEADGTAIKLVNKRKVKNLIEAFGTLK